MLITDIWKSIIDASNLPEIRDILNLITYIFNCKKDMCDGQMVANNNIYKRILHKITFVRTRSLSNAITFSI